MGVRILSLLLCVGLSSAQELVDDFQCPDEYRGYYPHLISCDKYWYCEDGIAELKTCGNGLGFLDTDPSFNLEQCAELHLVECGDRTEIEPPISTKNCPRLYGTYPDETSCSVFFTCVNGIANRYECPPGLAYDEVDRGCKWADQVPECQNVVLDNEEEFICPRQSTSGAFTKHAHPGDCRQYFVCISGVPREYGCPLGTVFGVGGNEFVGGECKDPKEVPECEKYYGELEFDETDLSRAGADRPSSPTRERVSTSRSRSPANNRDSVNRIETEEVQRRPAPASLQSIVNSQPQSSDRSQSRPRNRPARPSRPVAAAVENSPEPSTGRSTGRLQVITDRPRTTFPRRPESLFTTTTATTARPFTSVFAGSNASPKASSLSTALPGKNAAVPSSVAGNSKGLPDPVPAAPGPNGEDYYYYYYYFDEDEEKEQ